MIFTRVLVAVLLVAVGTVAWGDWVETNNDGGAGALDYESTWVAIYDGDTTKPVTSWHTAANLAAAGFGSDPGWTGNVIAITDDDTQRFAAENKFELFTDVRVTAATSTVDVSTLSVDIEEEFGVMARAGEFFDGDPINTLDAYAATFSVDGATALNDPMKFSLYKIVNGAAVATETDHPLVTSSLDDFIVSIELTATGGQITARLFEDSGDLTPIATLSMDDSSPLPAGYSGVLCWDVASPNGIGALYDTLESVAVPEPSAMVLLAIGIAVALAYPLKRQKLDP